MNMKSNKQSSGTSVKRKSNGVAGARVTRRQTLSATNEISEESDQSERNEGIAFERNNRLKTPQAPEVMSSPTKPLSVQFHLDIMSTTLFFMALATRLYRLDEPRFVIFDEMHYGKYVSLYMKNTFFFDSHPPLGKLLVAGVAHLAGYNGTGNFGRIGNAYPAEVPVFALRLVPALCGSLLVPAAYHFVLQLGLTQWTASIAAFLILCDNALLTQSRFILMDSIMILFALCGLISALKFSESRTNLLGVRRWSLLALTTSFLTFGLCVKYIGMYSYILGMWIIIRDGWQLLPNKKLSARFLAAYFCVQALTVLFITTVLYLSVFYVHLSLLTKAGPHDSIMTSAFQASLEGGLTSITRGQPTVVVHGSQITLRHTFGRTCWLHSHSHVYPVRYDDNRGSSHQQQVTCYSFKDVNNWWIVKRPSQNNLVVPENMDPIQHGDIIQLVHGMTSRALNSHDVAAPVSAQNQEVSCYIDYNVSMPAQNLWKVEIVNKEKEDSNVWYAINSQVRLIHMNTSQALKFSGRQLPEWGFNQHEVVTDRVINQPDTIWNVEEHRYTASEDQKEREMQMVKAEMIPLNSTALGFWPKFLELQYKMLFGHHNPLQTHMYSSEPIEWPFMAQTIAYWIDFQTSAQIHLVGNVMIWWSGVVALACYSTLLVLYLLRRQRRCYDVAPDEWSRFESVGQVLLLGFCLHYFPFFAVDHIMFLHYYLPALIFKILLLAAFLEHLVFLTEYQLGLKRVAVVIKVLIVVWAIGVVWVFKKLSILSYGFTPTSSADLTRLKWRDSWSFFVNRN